MLYMVAHNVILINTWEAKARKLSQVQDQLRLFGEVQASLVYSIRLSQKLKQKKINSQKRKGGRGRLWETLDARNGNPISQTTDQRSGQKVKNSVGGCQRSSLGRNAAGTAFSAFGVL